MKAKQTIASLALAGLVSGLVPAAPALADGRASTRNILLGVGAATYLIIQHNRKVHQQRAEAARQQAAESSYYSQPSYSGSSGGGSSYSGGSYSGGGYSGGYSSGYSGSSRGYSSYHSGYAGGSSSALQREVQYQHKIIVQQRQQIARLRRASHGTTTVDYGWGRL